jgi:hypothetical protein
MLEVAEDAREEQKQVDLIIKKTIQQQLAKIQKEYRFKKSEKTNTYCCLWA